MSREVEALLVMDLCWEPAAADLTVLAMTFAKKEVLFTSSQLEELNWIRITVRSLSLSEKASSLQV